MLTEEENETYEQEFIEVIGANVHNLRNVDVKIPRNKLIVITGLSGSGKSSLAFDTIYAEGQRRYMETFSSYARQFIGEMERPDVEQINGLSPVISIEQKTTGRNPRSTVGTITEIYDFMRLFFARLGEAYSYVTGEKMVKYTDEQILNKINADFDGQNITILAPLIKGRKGHYRELFDQIRKQGFVKVRIDKVMVDLEPNMQIDRFKTHDIEVVIDRLQVLTERQERINLSVTSAMKLGQGNMLVIDNDQKVYGFSKHLMDPTSGISYEEPSPNTFSFNSPYGACPNCKGLGRIYEVDMNRVIPDDTKSINDVGIVPFGEVRENYIFSQLRQIATKYKFTFSTPVKEIPQAALDLILHGGGDKGDIKLPTTSNDFVYNLASEGIVNMLKRWHNESTSEKIGNWAEEFLSVGECSECDGFRLKKESLFFKINGKNIGELSNTDIQELFNWFENIESTFTERQQLIAKDIIKEIHMRLGFLLNVGLDYLTLNRNAGTLSGGEAQRIRLATQIGSQLTGITYILDEPSIGLHQRDNQKLIEVLKNLANIGNTVIVVEHDKDIMMASDYLIDMGPGAGKNGGLLVGEGTPQQFLTNDTLTSSYLKNEKRIEIPVQRRKGTGKTLEIIGATGNNLKNVSVKFPLGTLICVTGVSGSGKSTLINDTLYPIIRNKLYRSTQKPEPYKELKGIELIDKIIEIDQSPIGRTPRSNPVTYIGVFTDIRKLFSMTADSKIRGYGPGRFSFNVKGGRCETCEGSGLRVIEMNFLPDVQIECETCLGRRYNRETLEVLYKGKSINDVLNLSVDDAVEFFANIPNIYRKIKTMQEVGLGYITLGQQATTLSGGEAQRVKLSEELSKKDSGNTLYILDEPTTGLHFQDIEHLLEVINKLVNRGNTAIVIEHNLDVIKTADYIIDMGPEGGNRGGTVVFEGTPEKIIKDKNSITGQFLALEMLH